MRRSWTSAIFIIARLYSQDATLCFPSFSIFRRNPRQNLHKTFHDSRTAVTSAGPAEPASAAWAREKRFSSTGWKVDGKRRRRAYMSPGMISSCKLDGTSWLDIWFFFPTSSSSERKFLFLFKRSFFFLCGWQVSIERGREGERERGDRKS